MESQTASSTASSTASAAVTTSSSNGLGKLQGKLRSKSISSKRRRKKQGPGADGSSDDIAVPPPSRGQATPSDGRNDNLAMAVQDDFANRGVRENNAVAAGFPGIDDDVFFSNAKRSSTSSPLAPGEHAQVYRTSDFADRSSRASTGLAESSDTAESIISRASSSKSGLVPPKLKARRSVSPVGRFRDVFKPKKSPAPSLGSSSPERQRSTTDVYDTPSPDAESSSALPIPPVPAIPPIPPVEASASLASATDDQPSDIVKASPTEKYRRLSRGQKIDTASSTRPETPPTKDKPAPIIVNTPPTPTDPSHPSSWFTSRFAPSPESAAATTAAAASTIATTASLTGSPSSTAPYANAFVSASPSGSSGSMISQRRARSGSASLVPSKLSNITLAPLSPTPENAPVTPSATGFFSSVLSVAQNATSSLSNTITNTNISAPWNSSNSKKSIKDQDDRSHSGDSKQHHHSDLDHEDDDSFDKANDRVTVESSVDLSSAASSTVGQKEPAVRTLGQGNLSLSHLGIIDQPTTKTMASSVGPPSPTRSNGLSANGNSGAAPGGSDPRADSPAPVSQSRASDLRTDTRNRSESAPVDSSHAFANTGDSNDRGSDDVSLPTARPGSMPDVSGQDEDVTPPPASLYGDRTDHVQRTASIRSALERRRKRNSSAATGGTANTIAAAIAAANASVARPSATNNMPKLTGFAVASKKRNRDFHNLFKSVPDDDYLIEDYSCALQREILAHGRLYVSEGHLCFSSNILGWVTTLVMSFDEIVAVEKRSTALVFKNGLMISTLHAKHIFASFASRDSTYDLIVKIWKLGHPSLQSSLNGVHIDETGGDKTEKIEADGDASIVSPSPSGSEDETEDDSDEVYDEDAESSDVLDSTQSTDASGGIANVDGEKSAVRKPSGALGTANGTSADKRGDAMAGAATAGAGAGGGTDVEFPGPQSHPPTDCGDAASHYDKILADEVIPAPLGKVFSYMFGAISTTWMAKWLANDQKCFDIQMTDKKGLGPDNKSRTYSYIKPLYASIGPKQTKCMVTEQIDAVDFEKAVNVTCSTQNPDVPSGNVFTVKTKYCFSWAENNATRVQINCTIEWTGKSWLKAPIEKGANDGQAQYCRDIFASLREALSSRPRSAPLNGASGKGKKKGRRGKSTTASGPASNVDGGVKKPSGKTADWGLLEPVHGVLGPVFDILQPLLTGNVLYGLLVGLLVAMWFGFGSNNRQPPRGQPGGGIGYWGGVAYPDRLAAYEEMWRREESELWEWLEERVGLDRLTGGTPPVRKKVLEPRTVEEKLREERMDEREIMEAIRVTEEKLTVLRSVVERQDETDQE